MSGLSADLKYAWRMLLRSPVFSAVAICSLALGIGANTAIFSLIDQLLIRLLPVKDPEQLVMISSRGSHSGNNRGARMLSYPMYQDFQKRGEAFSEVFCRRTTDMAVTYGDSTERVTGELVSGNYFTAMGVGAAVGRVFNSKEDDQVYKGHPVAVLSHQYWVSRFAADPKVVGQTIRVNNYPLTIVGVSAAGFTGLDPARTPQVRVPIQMKPLMTPAWDDLGNRRSRWVQVFGRMKPGFTAESARASLQPVFKSILDFEVTQPQMRTNTKYQNDRFLEMQVRVGAAGNGYSELRNSFETALVVLMAMVGLVLVIACANVASLLVARAAARQKEIAVRLSVGASRGQLIRQLLMESLLMSVIGGAAGIVFAVVCGKALLALLPAEGQPLLLQATPDLRVLLFSTALAFLTGVLFGLAPALQATRVDLASSLKDGSGAIAGSGSPVRLRKGLVTAQVALSFLLLAGAGLFVKSLANLQNMNSGFKEISNLLQFEVNPALNGYKTPQVMQFYKDLLAGVRTVPGVETAGFASVALLAGDEWDSTMSVEGHQPKDGEDMQAFMNSVSPGYFTTMGTPLLEGRDFDERDAGGDKFKVAIVNRKFARHYFGERSPIGRKIGFGSGPGTKFDIEIVGMVEDSLYEGPREGTRRQVFAPHLQAGWPGSVMFYARTKLGSDQMFPAMRAEVRKLDAAMPVYAMKTLAGQLDETLLTERMIASLSAAFGVAATLLAAVGLYGVMAFVVARRTREIGLRVALGAPPSQVIWLVMREVLLLLGVGLAVGIPAAMGLGRYVSTQLFGVQAQDWRVAGAAALTLVLVAAVAGYVPALRASRIDPIRALRYE